MAARTGWRYRLRAIALKPRRFTLAVSVVILIVLALAALERDPTPPAVLPAIHFSALAAPPAPLSAHTTVLRVEPGDTLETILSAGGLSRAEGFEIVQSFRQTLDPRRLMPGETIRFRTGDDGSVASLDMKITGWGRVIAERSDDGFEVESVPAEDVTREIVVSARIDSSLYEAIQGAGQSPRLVPPMVDVFQWDIDFFRLREGDSFSVVIDERWVGDDFVGYGPLKAARFTHSGKVFEAYRFEAPGQPPGYYASNGSPMRKQFLKAPLRFSRITSGFTNRRFHPVLKEWRAHPAIDYGAPAGTPVLATADGKVTFAGRGAGEGNFVKIRHGGGLETYYLHLSRFARGIRSGSHVNQGQVIGYVGSTGLATAPHLDYRIKRDGKYINPLTLRAVSPEPLRKDLLGRFREQIARFVPVVHGDPSVHVASNDPGAGRSTQPQ